MLGTEPRWSHDDKAELEQLSDWTIDADGLRLAVSAPSRGIRGPQGALTLGISTLDLPDARRMIGRRVQLLSRTQGRIGALRVKSVDPELSLLTAALETDT